MDFHSRYQASLNGNVISRYVRMSQSCGLLLSDSHLHHGDSNGQLLQLQLSLCLILDFCPFW